jgi:hypothetical protein
LGEESSPERDLDRRPNSGIRESFLRALEMRRGPPGTDAKLAMQSLPRDSADPKHERASLHPREPVVLLEEHPESRIDFGRSAPSSATRLPVASGTARR